MAPDNNGITQSPFSEAVCPTPNATDGDQGTGGGLTADPGPQGIINSPFDKAIVPTPGMDGGGGPFGNVAKLSKVAGSTHEGETLSGDITLPPHNTIDKR